MKKNWLKTKKGATSFYIVAFSTLILVIIAASFTAVILSEMTRSANDDLAQSAYDSALAGVEDAKLALYNYQKCLAEGATAEGANLGDGVNSCQDVMSLMEEPSCDMVAKILGRIAPDASGEVLIEEQVSDENGTSSSSNNLLQAYTCVKVSGVAKSYKSTLSGSDAKVVRVKLADKEAKEIKRVRVSWRLKNGDTEGSTFNFSHINNGIVFPSLSEEAVPPMISVSLVQTAESFTLDQFKKSEDNKTNRGTLFLAPFDTTFDYSGFNKVRSFGQAKESDKYGNYISAYNSEGENSISADIVAKSNDHTVKNLPIAVGCNTVGNDYPCSTDIELPDVIGGDRSDETFMFVISVPYGHPETEFDLQFYTDDSTLAGSEGGTLSNNDEEEESVTLLGQLVVDSTGRANDLYRRIETRLEATNEFDYPFPIYALELLGPEEGTNPLLQLPKGVHSEYNFNQ